MESKEAIECLKFEKSGCRNFFEYVGMNDVLENASSECGWMTKAINKAIEALEKEDKYRWHDLRKNPNDLPQNSEEDYMVAEVYDDETVYSISYGKWVDAEHYDAWKEIEPFEVTE